MESRMRKTALILTLSLFVTGCAGQLPKMERPISLFAGCPQFEGICKFSKKQVEAKVAPSLPSVKSEDVSEWVEINIDGVIDQKVRVLPAKSKEFKKYVSLSAQDLGVLLKHVDDLKRKIVGNR